MRAIRSRSLAVLAAAGVAVAGCGSDEPTTQSMSVIEHLTARHESASRGSPLYAEVDQAMPNVLYTIDGGDPVSVADAYVVGSVAQVTAGRSFTWSEGAEAEIRTELPFNDASALVSTVHVTVDIERSIVAASEPQDVAQSLQPGRQVTFGLALGSPVDLAAAEREVRGLGTLAVLLYHPSPVFDYDASLWAVVEDGAFLGVVDPEGIVSFPVIEAEVAGAAGTALQDLETPDWTKANDVETTEQGYQEVP